MIVPEQYDDVTRLRMTRWRGRLVGYDVSAYLVGGTLVDTGFPRAASEFSRFLDGRSVRGAVVTHWHEDHAGNASLVAARGIPLAISPHTLAQLHGGAAASIRFYRRFIWGVGSPLTSTVVPFDAAPLAVIHAPGHTADHHVVWDAERETLFSGDLFLGVKVRATFPDEEPRQLITTLRAVAALRPRRMFDSHRGPVGEPTHALLAKADWLEDVVSRIESKMEAGWSDRAITRHLLGRENLVSLVSSGEYSKLTLVRVIRRTKDGVRAPVDAG